MKALMSDLGYTFADETLLKRALTHPSRAGEEHVGNNQRLEFLGDAVLQLVISRYLYDNYPDQEGTLSRARARLVCEETLCEAAKNYRLGRYLLLSAGEERTGGRDRPSILADAMEAVIAAVYLDGGYECAAGLIMRALEKPLRDHPVNRPQDYDHKSALQITTQRLYGIMPVYELVECTGEAHCPTFVMRVLLDGKELARGSGRTKQAAQQQAARKAAIILKGSCNG